MLRSVFQDMCSVHIQARSGFLIDHGAVNDGVKRTRAGLQCRNSIPKHNVCVLSGLQGADAVIYAQCLCRIAGDHAQRTVVGHAVAHGLAGGDGQNLRPAE